MRFLMIWVYTENLRPIVQGNVAVAVRFRHSFIRSNVRWPANGVKRSLPLIHFWRLDGNSRVRISVRRRLEV